MKLIYSSIYLLLSIPFAIQAQTYFGPEQYVIPELANINDIEIADLDLDGDSDIIGLGNFSNSVQIIENQNTSFGTPVDLYNDFEDPRAITIDDFNGDSFLDILVVENIGNRLFLLENLGSLEFSQPEELVFPPRSYLNVKSADIDGDGDIDFVATAAEWQGWFENDGTGQFVEEHLISTSTEINYGSALALADINNDSYIDIVTVSSNEAVTEN
ncbi:MAG: FG-GAP repeat domain-containing protein, partial [Flavobacteriales bacterium]